MSGVNRKHETYTVRHSRELRVVSGKSYYISKSEIPAGYRMSTAPEELMLQFEADGDTRYRTNVYNNLFVGKRNNEYPYQMTESFLRVPHRKLNPSKPDYVDSQGRKYWVREFGHACEIIGLVHVPEGNARVVPKTEDKHDIWNFKVGIPIHTTSDEQIRTNLFAHNVHFEFQYDPPIDPRTGEKDVMIVRTCGWGHTWQDKCIFIKATLGREIPHLYSAFRPAQGPLPLIENTSSV